MPAAAVAALQAAPSMLSLASPALLRMHTHPTASATCALWNERVAVAPGRPDVAAPGRHNMFQSRFSLQVGAHLSPASSMTVLAVLHSLNFLTVCMPGPIMCIRPVNPEATGGTRPRRLNGLCMASFLPLSSPPLAISLLHCPASGPGCFTCCSSAHLLQHGCVLWLHEH